jgi:hypothetical protein
MLEARKQVAHVALVPLFLIKFGDVASTNELYFFVA